MDSLHSTMNQHVKGKHLSFEERVIIQTRLKDGYSIRAIARELGCSPSTISYEVKRGTVSLYHGKQQRYKADHGQSVYQVNRRHCGRKSDFLKKADFISYVIKHFFEDGWSLDVCANRSLAIGEFSHHQTVCTRTLYNYVDQGLMTIKNYDLPEKLKRNTKLHHVRKNKKKLGRSIEERPKEIDQRNEFGHWECDLVLGHKTKDDQVLLTLSERMSREFLIIRIPDKTFASVMRAFKVLQKQYSEDLYYAHPILLVIRELWKGTMALFADSFLKESTSITILSNRSLILKPGAIHYQERSWHTTHQMKSSKEN